MKQGLRSCRLGRDRRAADAEQARALPHHGRRRGCADVRGRGLHQCVADLLAQIVHSGRVVRDKHDRAARAQLARRYAQRHVAMAKTTLYKGGWFPWLSGYTRAPLNCETNLLPREKASLRNNIASNTSKRLWRWKEEQEF